MFKNQNLNSLLQLAEESRKQMNLQMSIFDGVLNEMVKEVPEKDKDKIEEFKALTQRAINLAKEGKTEEAQELIKNFQNGCKNNRQTV